MDEKTRQAIENAILALQQVAMAHPAADEHSRAMYRAADDARRELLAVLKQ